MGLSKGALINVQTWASEVCSLATAADRRDCVIRNPIEANHTTEKGVEDVKTSRNKSDDSLEVRCQNLYPNNLRDINRISNKPAGNAHL